MRTKRAAVFQFVGSIEAVHINLPVTVLIWLMIIPMLIKIDLKQLRLGLSAYSPVSVAPRGVP